ncbi:MAG: hypothetical protein WEC33_00075, partial [Dehalococcoidia bacterium]
MGRSRTGAKPLPAWQRWRRTAVVAWNFLVIYLGYKRIQRKKNLPWADKDRLYSEQHARAAERLYRTATNIEGLLIKTCQFISSRADVAPPEYVRVLSRLQDQVPPRPYEMMRAQVRREREHERRGRGHR